MIGHLQGKVLFSDGQEVIIFTNSGIGYQVHYPKVVREGRNASIFISHIIREASEELYGFETLREKKLFELLLTVKGVGPKSAFSLLKNLDFETICESIALENTKTLSKAPGIGAKAAAQMILDLSKKIHKVKMYSPRYQIEAKDAVEETNSKPVELEFYKEITTYPASQEASILNEAIMACKELGFKEDLIIPMAQKILQANDIQKAEQLVHLVLREV
jgi:holliday junction DNA helicase RuvA